MNKIADEDFNVLEYARSHGLCVDYLTELPGLRILPLPFDDTLIEDLQDRFYVTSTKLISESSKERLTLNKETAAQLRKFLSVPPAPVSGRLLSDERRHGIQKLKQELPLLPTDNELDLIEFGNRSLPSQQNLGIPFELIDCNYDQDLGWPANHSGYLRQADDSIKNEKLAVSRDAFVFLQNVIHENHKPEDAETCKSYQRTHDSDLKLRYTTPPLFPLSPPQTQFIPSSPACRLPLPSESSDSVTQEVKHLEDKIMDADSLSHQNIHNHDSMLLDNDHPLQFVGRRDDTMASKKRQVHDLKVEGPLTPRDSSTSPLKKLKSVSFAVNLHTHIPEVARWDGDSRADDDAESVNISDYDEFFDQIRPLVDQAKRKIDHEQLLVADTTARVDVPDVDFVLPVAPWDEYSERKASKRNHKGAELRSQMRFILRIRREDLMTAATWHGLSALERGLQWSILVSKVSSVNVSEKLHGEAEVAKFMTDNSSANVVSSGSLIWKPDGLRVFDPDEEDEDIKTYEIEEQQDIDALVRKRKLELEECTQESQLSRVTSISGSNAWQYLRRSLHEDHQSRNDSQENGSIGPAYLSATVVKHRHSQPNAQGNSGILPLVANSGLMFGGSSAKVALQKFMETRNERIGPVCKNAEPEEFPSVQNKSSKAKCLLPPHSVHSQHGQTEAKMTIQAPQALLNVGARRSPPIFAVIPESRPPCSIMASSKFLQQTYLRKQVEKLYPDLEIVYRDYNLLHSPAEETDFLLSPCTGLIVSTLQQIKQRALPGHKEDSPLRARIMSLSSRYERLIVLVSEGLSREMEEQGERRPRDFSDSEAMKQLENFASQLEGEVLIKYIEGGVRGLAYAIVAEIAAYSLPHGSADIGDVKPSVEETTWEIFLRRAGLNSFAAQVVAAKLSPPFKMHVPIVLNSSTLFQERSTIALSGLSAFFMMSEEERVQYFQTVMGGSRILTRLGRMLDKGWISAAHGYAM